MMKFNEPVFTVGQDRVVRAWKYLLDPDYSARLYDCQVILVDDHGGYYYTTEPMVVVRDNIARIAVTLMTRTEALGTLTIASYKIICKDVWDILRPKYVEHKYTAYDDDDNPFEATQQVKLDQWIILTENRFHSPVAMVSGDNFRPACSVNISRNELERV